MQRLVKILLKIIGFGLFIFVLIVVAGLIYSTSHGYMTWWFKSSGQVTVNGVQSGYMHRNRENSALIITRVDLRPSQSYLVWIRGKKDVTHCGEWHATRFPAFSIGDVNPPCSFFTKSSDTANADEAVSSTLTVRPGFVEFQTVQGKKVSASW